LIQHRSRLRAVAAALAAMTALAVAPRAHAATAPAQVFAPNPVADLGIETLTDRKDADFFSADPVLRRAYHRVTLTDLTSATSLSGAYVTVKSETGPAAVNTGSGFIFTRDQDQFEQVMAYYWITQAQRYIQSLGFGSTLPAVDRRQVSVRINQLGGDNSFFRDTKTDITYGKGGVDDAEDAEVVVHEYGHSVQDAQVPGFGTSPDAGAVGEGFGDYLAVTVSAAVAPTADEPCVADWDSTSYTVTVPHCLRRVDGTKHYPEDLARPREVHADGEIWSRALWDIRAALGAKLADTIIIRAQFGFTPAITMPAAAAQTIRTAALYGRPAERAVTAAFAARGLA
jgi:Zn-dependent metalloprotease